MSLPQRGSWSGIFTEFPASEAPLLGPSHALALLSMVCSGSSHIVAESLRPPEQAPPHTAQSWPPARRPRVHLTGPSSSPVVFLPSWGMSNREVQFRRNQYSQVEKNLLHLQQINLAQIYSAPAMRDSLSRGRSQRCISPAGRRDSHRQGGRWAQV